MLNKVKELIPTTIRSKFTNRPILQKIVKNIGWLTFERFLELVVALLVGVWVARYLGPSDFGLMNFAIAFTVLFTPFLNLGLDVILTRELVSQPKKKYVLLGTVFWLKLISSIIVGFIMLILIYLIKSSDFILFLMIFIYFIGNIINSLSIMGNYFESKIESNKIVKSSTFALILTNFLKIVLIILNFSVIWFVVVSLVNTIVKLSFYLVYYFKDNQEIFKWKFNFELSKKLLLLSWPLILSSVFLYIYLRIDQVMLGLILTEYEVGVYSVAVKLSEISYFLPTAVSISLFPILIKSRKVLREIYYERLQKMFYFFTWFPLLIIIPIFIFSNDLILFFYGPDYLSAGVTLSILIWALLAISIRVATDNYLNSKKLYTLTFYSSLIGAITNIIFNLILIPLYGINGAAIATVISYFFVAYVSNLFFKETRLIFFMQLKSFNFFVVLKYLVSFLKR